MDRNYGISGYQPSKRPTQPDALNEEGESVVKPRIRTKDYFQRARKSTIPVSHGKWPLHKKILLALAAIFAACIFVIWFFLGEFRFMLWRAPSITGFPFGTRTYIVLFQNNNELSPTGGLISNYMELTFSNGIYTGITFHDANFDPDTQIDGMITVDFHFLEQWVGMYDSVTIEGTTFTKQNLFEALATRKDIAGPLVQTLLTKTLVLPWRLLAFRDLLAEGFHEKHALAAFSRSGLASSFRLRNWDGALPKSDMGDFLVVNEGNYGGIKTDRYLTRDVEYELEVTDKKDVLGNPVVNAIVSITLSNEGNYNSPLSGTYTGYLRTLIPLGAKISKGSNITEDRTDSEVLGELVTLNPGESVTYTYSYELPEYVWNDDMYYLHLHKQPGTDQDRYRVIVKAPEGMSLDEPNFDVRESVAFLDLNLLTDTNLSFSLLTTSGMTMQPQESYEVVFEGLTDMHGNVQSPASDSVTVVQGDLPVEPEESVAEASSVEETGGETPTADLPKE